MSKNLVIVESPTKEKTISKYLGKNYTVKSSYGHVRDLPKRELGVDKENNFEPKYVVMAKAKKVIAELKKHAKKAAKVYLATDYDREGEAIAWHLKNILNLDDSKTKRITFHEITKEAITEAVKNPRSIDPALVNSQQARRILDRLFGYELSPLLWRKVKKGLSAGRVQSAAVRLVCDREEEIKNFKSVEYWTVHAILDKKTGNHDSFKARLTGKEGRKYEKLGISKELSEKVKKDIESSAFTVQKIESKERKRSPYAPYTTSTLQQDASRKITFSAAKTMVMAQNLYEGISIGNEGNTGLITYMRTDSVNVAKSAQAESLKYIEETYGKDNLPLKPRIYKTKSKGAQEAHEAIRPTSVYRTPKSVKKYLKSDQYKLYDLIWKRFMASQMADAVYDTVSVDILADIYNFTANGSTLKFPGFLEVYNIQESEDSKDEDETTNIPPLSEKEELNLKELIPLQHFTEPPPRYNEASIIRALEEYGIGRPSTYAPTINTITTRNYVRLEKRRFYSTNLGALVNGILKSHFSNIVNLEFTASIENELDNVAEGKSKWEEIVREFYLPFKKNLELAEKNLKHQKLEPEKTDELCPKCKKPMVIRESFRGRFMACSGFPECRTTFSIDRSNQIIVKPKPEMTNLVCEKCGKPMVKRIGRRGPFLACSGFPKCRNTKKIQEDSKD